MPYADKELRLALAVACPYCKVPAGEWCRSSKRGKWSSTRTAIHVRRIAMGKRSMKLPQGDMFPHQLMIRASGDAICETCGRAYRDHPMDEWTPSGMDGRPFLHIRCDGVRLKL